MKNIKTINLQPLDIIFFSGTSIISNIIKRSSKYRRGMVASHLALVVNKEVLPHLDCMEEGKLYIVESTYKSESKVYHGYKCGTQLRDLHEAVNGYINRTFSISDSCQRPRAYVAKMKNNPWENEKNRPVIRAKIIEWYDNIIRYGYHSTFIPQLGSIWGGFRKFGDRYRSYGNKLYCSQIIKTLLQDLGLTYDRNVHIKPVDFLDIINVNTGEYLFDDPVEVCCDYTIYC